MTQSPTPHRRAAVLLLTAAALSFTPALAQEAQPPVDEPIVDTAPTPVPQPVESVPPTPSPVAAPVAVAPAPAPAPVVEAQQPPARATRTPRAAPRPAARAPARAVPAPAAAPAPAPAAAATAPLAAETAPPAPAAGAVPPPVTLPETPAEAAPEQTEQSGGSILPWLIAGLLAAGALAFFLLRRRRRAPVEREAFAYDEPAHEPVGAPAEDRSLQTTAAAAAVPAAMAWEESPDEPAAAVIEDGVPALDLELRPRRAGVTGSEAVVEFELDVANHGTAAARDVRVSTWMFPAGADQGSESERALIERPDDADLHEIGAGAGGSIARSVTLPTSEVGGDAVLPMVVAEARYRLPDGSEARTSATYAVGVPDGDELAHFAIDNPSGLHEEVVAWELGKTEPA